MILSENTNGKFCSQRKYLLYFRCVQITHGVHYLEWIVQSLNLHYEKCKSNDCDETHEVECQWLNLQKVGYLIIYTHISVIIFVSD